MLSSVEDVRRMARRRLPKIFFDYIDGGAFGEKTLEANTRDYDAWLLEQKVNVDVSVRDLGKTILGKRRALPFLLGPVGFSGLFAPRGEILAARAAHAAGIPFCVSNFGITRIEDLCSASDGDIWFQLYLIKDRDLVLSFMRRAEAAGVEALCMTVDSAVGGVRERDNRNGFRNLARLTPGMMLSMATRPRWCASVARAGIPSICNLADRPEYGRGAFEQAVKLGGQMDPSVTWADVRWVRDRWRGKFVVKGILSAADAIAAADVGADAVIVSNHGGRQLDSTPSTISVLPEVVAAVGDRVEVLLDGGIRRGSHIVKALALGARGVLLGRAYAYGLGANGQEGVSAVIAMLATEIDVTIGHMGLAQIEDIASRRDQLLRLRTSLPYG